VAVWLPAREAAAMTAIQPMTITLRQPDVDKAELVITLPGQPSMVLPVGFAAVRLLNSQTASALKDWPVQEVPAM
jgi:hypothetical protein